MGGEGSADIVGPNSQSEQRARGSNAADQADPQVSRGACIGVMGRAGSKGKWAEWAEAGPRAGFSFLFSFLF
jgi:hypothetical protein